jgi:hypothetical protein
MESVQDFSARQIVVERGIEFGLRSLKAIERDPNQYVLRGDNGVAALLAIPNH